MPAIIPQLHVSAMRGQRRLTHRRRTGCGHASEAVDAIDVARGSCLVLSPAPDNISK